MIVDHQTHWYPEAAFRLLDGTGGYPRAERRGDTWYVQAARGCELGYPPSHYELDLHLASMDEHGIDAMVAATAGLGDVARLDIGLAVELTQLLNEEYARAQRDHPGRFFGLACLPLQAPDRAVAMLEQALGGLGLRGLYVPSNLAGEPIVRDDLLPVYETVAAAGRPLVLHPSMATVMSRAYGRFGREIEMTGVALRHQPRCARALLRGRHGRRAGPCRSPPAPQRRTALRRRPYRQPRRCATR